MNEKKSELSQIEYQLSEVVLSFIAPELRREVGQAVMPPPIHQLMTLSAVPETIASLI